MDTSFLSLLADGLMLAAFTIGLGAVTVVDIHGFLGRNSTYWTEATTRTHKVTKPLIWLGSIFLALGSLLQYGASWQLLVVAILILNGLFLTFGVSKFLLKREREGRAAELLPKAWQQAITCSFLISAAGWWGSFVAYLFHIQK
jgi:hypothetical protein